MGGGYNNSNSSENKHVGSMKGDFKTAKNKTAIFKNIYDDKRCDNFQCVRCGM